MGHVTRAACCFLVLVLGRIAVDRPASAGEAAEAAIPSRDAYGSALAGVPGPALPRLRLVWIDVLGAAPFAYAVASREAAVILGAAGVESAWSVGGPSTVTNDTELKVVLMAAVTSGAGLPARVMGGTRRGGQSHSAWIYLSNVLLALGLPETGAGQLSGIQQRQVALALGRVIAHEVVHAVAPDLPHSRNGLMARTINRSLLLQARVALGPAEQRAFRAGVAAFLGPPAVAGEVVARAARR